MYPLHIYFNELYIPVKFFVVWGLQSNGCQLVKLVLVSDRGLIWEFTQEKQQVLSVIMKTPVVGSVKTSPTPSTDIRIFDGTYYMAFSHCFSHRIGIAKLVSACM